MVDINEVYENVQSLAQKAKHGTIRVVDFNRYANLSSIDLFNERIGSVRDYYRLQKAINKMTPGMNKEVDQSIRPFFVENTSIAMTAGKGTIPTDCELLDTVMFGTKAVKWIPFNKIASYLNSTIDVPTVDYPVYSDLATQLIAYPSSMTPLLLSYYKTPQTVNWGYTMSGSIPVYNVGASVNFEWFATEKIQLIMRILAYVGITIRDSELVQYATVEENTIA